MSETFSLACRDCKKHIWIAQGSYTDKAQGHVYCAEQYRKGFYLFLREHQGHNLVFDQHCEGEIADYEEIEIDSSNLTKEKQSG